MRGFYLDVYRLLPEFLKKRINPLDFGIQEAVSKVATESAGLVVLDAGAGESRFSGFFSQHFYVAVDSGVGDRSWDYSGIHLCADLTLLPLRTECIDLVVNTQVLEHVPDPRAALTELSRVLRRGGRLVLTAPQGWPEHQQPNDFFRFTRYSLALLLRQAGFSDVSIAPMGGFFHYLGHRCSYIPKVLFQSRRGVVRVILFPLELGCLFLFSFLAPLVCYYLDELDAKKEFTLGYRVLATKESG